MRKQLEFEKCVAGGVGGADLVSVPQAAKCSFLTIKEGKSKSQPVEP